MGTDIYSSCQILRDGRWRNLHLNIFPKKYEDGVYSTEPNIPRSYSLFTFLAKVREPTTRSRGYNIEPLSLPRGLPEDLQDENLPTWAEYTYAHSWYLLSELLAVDYDVLGYRELFPDEYFESLEQMKTLDPDSKNIRIIFGFDC